MRSGHFGANMLPAMSTVAEKGDAAVRPAEVWDDGLAAPVGRSQPLVAAIAVSLAAGAIHALAMVDHFDHYWLYGVFFLAVTYGQAVWPVWVDRHPHDRRALVIGAAGNLLVAAVWVVSRTLGPPIGPEAWEPERIGAMDVMATLDQLVIAALVVVLVAPRSRLGQRLFWLRGGHAVRLGIMLCAASLFSLPLGSHVH